MDCEIKPDGSVPEGCDLASGAVLTLHDGASSAHPEVHPMDTPAPTPTAPVESPTPAPVESPASAPVPAPAPVATTEHTEQASTPSADELGKLVNTSGGGTTGIVLAVLAVVGGGAAWKTYQRISEQKHEQNMKKLELDAKMAGLGGAQPPPCAVKQTEVDAKLSAFDARLAAAEKKSATLSADFDADDVERRIKKLEKAVKAMNEGG